MNTPADFLPMPEWLEQAWLERFLDRELAPSEQAWFEAYVLDKPELLERIEADSAVRAVVHADAAAFAAGAGDNPATATPIDLPRGGRATRRPPRAYWPMAACFVLGLGFGGLLLQSLDGGGPVGTLAAPSRLVYDSLRGSYGGPRVDPGDAASALVIVDVALPIGSTLESAEIELGDARRALPLAPISAEGFATWTVPAEWRGQGRMLLQVSLSSGQRERLELQL